MKIKFYYICYYVVSQGKNMRFECLYSINKIMPIIPFLCAFFNPDNDVHALVMESNKCLPFASPVTLNQHYWCTCPFLSNAFSIPIQHHHCSSHLHCSATNTTILNATSLHNSPDHHHHNPFSLTFSFTTIHTLSHLILCNNYHP